MRQRVSASRHLAQARLRRGAGCAARAASLVIPQKRGGQHGSLFRDGKGSCQEAVVAGITAASVSVSLKHKRFSPHFSNFLDLSFRWLLFPPMWHLKFYNFDIRGLRACQGVHAILS